MKAIQFHTLINKKHQALVQFPPDVTPGVHQILLVIDETVTKQSGKPRKTREEFKDLLLASESSLGFWENTVDDEVWNNA